MSPPASPGPASTGITGARGHRYLVIFSLFCLYVSTAAQGCKSAVERCNSARVAAHEALKSAGVSIRRWEKEVMASSSSWVEGASKLFSLATVPASLAISALERKVRNSGMLEVREQLDKLHSDYTMLREIKNQAFQDALQAVRTFIDACRAVSP